MTTLNLLRKQRIIHWLGREWCNSFNKLLSYFSLGSKSCWTWENFHVPSTTWMWKWGWILRRKDFWRMLWVSAKLFPLALQHNQECVTFCLKRKHVGSFSFSSSKGWGIRRKENKDCTLRKSCLMAFTGMPYTISAKKSNSTGWCAAQPRAKEYNSIQYNLAPEISLKSKFKITHQWSYHREQQFMQYSCQIHPDFSNNKT